MRMLAVYAVAVAFGALVAICAGPQYWAGALVINALFGVFLGVMSLGMDDR